MCRPKLILMHCIGTYFVILKMQGICGLTYLIWIQSYYKPQNFLIMKMSDINWGLVSVNDANFEISHFFSKSYTNIIVFRAIKYHIRCCNGQSTPTANNRQPFKLLCPIQPPQYTSVSARKTTPLHGGHIAKFGLTPTMNSFVVVTVLCTLQ